MIRPALLPLALAATLALAACATDTPAGLESAARAAAPDHWQSAAGGPAVPHDGQLAALQAWWSQFDDPLLAPLVARAERASPTLAAARARIAQGRAARVAAGAALGPSLNAGANLARGRFDLQSPVGTSAAASLGAAWELDVFGAGRAARDAAQARLEGAEAAWHGARVSVAAETALAYLQLRSSEAQRALAADDAASREESLRLAEASARAGLLAAGDVALARAGAAQARAGLTQWQAQCDAGLQALVALTATPSETLQAELAGRAARLPEPLRFAVPAVPAQALAQRPDVFGAGRDLLAAFAEVDQARAARYPRITLGGSIGPARFEAAGVTLRDTLWSVGPVSVSLPLFDGGVRGANVSAAQARLDAAQSAYAGQLRGAVREVEDALIALHSAAARADDARIAAEGLERARQSVDDRARSGLASGYEREDARRQAVAARAAFVDLQRERITAWIALYRALGGGWTAESTPPNTPNT